MRQIVPSRCSKIRAKNANSKTQRGLPHMAKRSKTTPDWLNGGPIDDDTPPGTTVDKRTLGRLFGLTKFAINGLIDRGLPVRVIGDRQTPWQFNTADVAVWLVEDAVREMEDDSDEAQLREAQRRKMQIQYETLRDRNAADHRELVTIDEAVTVLRENSACVRLHLGKVPAAVITKLATLSADDRRNASIVEFIVDDALNDAFRAISEDDGGDRVAA
jgi:phage terminase Nu1 subunit (DNA packaging protein)